MVENIRRIGIFMIAAQTMMHFAAGKQYEKYMRIITGIIILLMFISPFTSASGNPAAGWQAEIERMEQQMQNSIQREMPYAVTSTEAVVLQQIEEEMKIRLNDIVSDRNCSVTDVVIELEKTDKGFDAEGRGGRNWEFQRVTVTLQSVNTADVSDENEGRSIRIEEITVEYDPESDTEQKAAQKSSQDSERREYQQLFAQALGIADDRVEVIYRGGW